MRAWRARPDPFAAVWPEVEALLRQNCGLQAKTFWVELNERYAGRFSAGQLRTLQRRLSAWRATSGPDREVFFPQTHIPGEQAQSDFTDMRKLEVIIADQLFHHLLYHFVLTYSNWESISICGSESFESLSAGMQSALWRLGGVPLEHRTDNLSAATHELSESRGRDFTKRYRELIDYYGLRASRNFPGNAHENGDVESANGRLKNAIDQRLRLRGSRAFASREAYEGVLDTCIQARNATRHARIEEERKHLRSLPSRPLPSYRESYATVSRASAVRVLKHSYSVSSRLIGCQLRVRLHADIVELHYKGERVALMERLIGRDPHRVDYRHIIHSLVRKPGAFRRYVFREALFPTLEFRRTYDALLADGSSQADLCRPSESVAAPSPSGQTEWYCLARTQSGCEHRDAASQFCRVAACKAEHESRSLLVFCCEHGQRSYFEPQRLRFLCCVGVRLPCFEPAERAYACTRVDYV
jgi:hypothetical protein